MDYDIIFVTGEIFFDHPLSGAAILKRLLEKYGYTVGIIEQPQSEEEIKQLGKPKLFFAVSSGSIDSMVRNYTPLLKKRSEDKHLNYTENIPDRAVTVYSNWIKKYYKDSILVLGGTEASLRRFTHFDYWSNKIRRPISFDTRADLVINGYAEKQILDIANRIKNNQPLDKIPGTSIISKEVPKDFIELPTFEDVTESKEKYCDMQMMFDIDKNLAQKIDNRYVLQHKSPRYTPKDLDEYYSLPFSRDVPKELRGFQFSVVTHRGCIGDCNFCSLTLISGKRIISRSEESILKEIQEMIKHPHFRGNVDDLGGPSANMYGMDCDKCDLKNCLKCAKLDRSMTRYINLLKEARQIPGIKNVYIRSGIRHDLVNEEFIKELSHHIYDTLRIAPEHVNKEVLKLMNKDNGDYKEFVEKFKKYSNKEVSYYFMTAHPGSSMKEAKQLSKIVKGMKNPEAVQVFTPTPMTVSTAMYYTGMDPKTKKKIHVPRTFQEKKEQKRLFLSDKPDSKNYNKHKQDNPNSKFSKNKNFKFKNKNKFQRK
ncbi:YgiQ family radical SAM protein [Candidatus Woesearchaeota archaeon]|nr:YgiQ family radical SAM protein [Candidatus Woesearchaeota archaeon]